MKSERIHIRIKPEDKAKLQAVADKKRRTITSIIEELIENLLEEEMTTYIVINSDGKDEWASYEGTDLEEAIRIARLEYGRNKKSKQNYTVELRKMADDYESESDAYNYDLVEFI
jgi:hypothetical protein